MQLTINDILTVMQLCLKIYIKLYEFAFVRVKFERILRAVSFQSLLIFYMIMKIANTLKLIFPAVQTAQIKNQQIIGLPSTNHKKLFVQYRF